MTMGQRYFAKVAIYFIEDRLIFRSLQQLETHRSERTGPTICLLHLQ